ncbi:MAG: helix-hairpin-helix domain-containing protein, partial [Candidatus Muiribacteriaceae bacterium]
MSDKRLSITKKVKWVIFRKDTFHILDLEGGVKAKGHIFDAFNGDIRGLTFEFEGEYRTDKYGETFCFDKAQMCSDEMFFFLSSIVKGVGPSTAEAIIDRFGSDTEEIIEKTPWKLKQVSGLGDKRIQVISDSFRKFSHLRKLSGYLAKFGFSPHNITRIYELFKDKSLTLIENNPYVLCEISGINFEKVDALALNNDFPVKDEKRIRAGMEYIFVRTAYEEGHTYLSREVLIAMTAELLNINEDECDIIGDVLDQCDLFYKDEHEDIVALFTIKDYETF